jgi:hypothetical protein
VGGIRNVPLRGSKDIEESDTLQPMTQRHELSTQHMCCSSITCPSQAQSIEQPHLCNCCLELLPSLCNHQCKGIGCQAEVKCSTENKPHDAEQDGNVAGAVKLWQDVTWINPINQDSYLLNPPYDAVHHPLSTGYTVLP